MNHAIMGRGEASAAPRAGARALALAFSLPLAAGAACAQEAAQHATWLDTITVTGTRTETSVMNNPASVSVVGQEQLERQAPESIADLVRDVPGVEVVDASAPGMKRLRIRGESSHRVTILVDGQEITDHSDYGTPILVDPANVERIDVIRGPASVLYGAKAIGGVVNIITKRGAPKPIQLETGGTYYSGTRGWQGWAAVSGTVGDVDYRLSGSADRHHDREVPNGRYTQDGRLDGSSYRDSDMALHLGYTFGQNRNHYLALKAEQHILSTDSWTDPDYLQDPIRDFGVDLPKRDLRKVGLYYDAKDLSPVVRKIHVDAYRQTVDRLFENRVEVQPTSFMNVKNTATSDDRNLNYGGTAQIDLALHPDHYTIAGLQYLMDDLDTSKNSITTTHRTIPFPTTTVKVSPTHTRASIQTASLFAQDEWSFARDFKLTAGLRYYHVSTDSWTDPDYLQDPIRDFGVDLPKRDLRKVGLYYDAKDLSPVVRKIHVDAYRQTVDRLFENRVEVQPTSFMNVKNTATSDDRNLNYGGTAQIDLALHPDHYTIAGLQYLMDDLDTSKNSITTTHRTIPFPTTTVKVSPTHTRASIQTASLFAQDEWSFARDFKLTAGLRYYHVSTNLDDTTNAALAGQDDGTTNRLVKSLGLTWNGLEHTTLRALYSEGYTMPTLAQLYTDTTAGSSNLTRANPGLKPETSQNYELGARYQHAGVVLDAAAFYTQAKDYIGTAPCASAGTCPAGYAASDRTYINADRADTHGIELAAEYALPGTNFTPYVSGAWMRRELKYADYSTRDSGTPAFSGRAGVRYDTTLYGAEVWADLFVRAATSLKEATSATESERLPGWGTLNLAFGGTHGKDRKVSVGVQFNNLLDKEYRSAFDVLPGTGRSVEVTLRTTF